MRTIEEILKLKKYLVDDFYSKLRKEQQADNDYYNDIFDVTDIIKPPVKEMRTGRARRLIDGPADHIITSNPQAFRIPQKNTLQEKKVSEFVNNMLNIDWLPALKRQNPNAYKQHVKYNLLRGECWIQVVHNEAWVTGNKKKEGLPVIFRILEPMIVYASPNEDVNGVPEYVLLYYERMPSIVAQKYPNWSNPKHAGTGEKDAPKTVKWLEYWDADMRYFEADGEAVLKGKSQENIYKSTSFVHKLSGFGTDSSDGDPKDLVVGRLRFSRDSLRRECAIISSLDASIHTFANRSITVQAIDDIHIVPENFHNDYITGDGIVNVLPTGVKVEKAIPFLPEQPMFTYLAAVQADIEREDPLVLSGFPVGESGRLQDMTQSSALMRYASIVENTENAFATAISMALRIIDTVPGLRPDGLKPGDLDGNYDVKVQLKAKDPLADDRKAMLGSRLVTQNEIDPITNLTEFKGYTLEQAEDITIKKYAYRLIDSNPDIAAFIGWMVVKKTGMAEAFSQYMEQKKMLGQGGQTGALTQQPGNTEMQRRMGEMDNSQDFNMMDVFLKQNGARQPPAMYTRT